MTEDHVSQVATPITVACGVDLIEIDTIAGAVRIGGDRFLGRVYTEAELTQCQGNPRRLAERFAAKEAIAKALGTGLDGLDWTELEVLSDGTMRPRVLLHGAAAVRATTMRIEHWAVNVSHSRTHAVAVAVASGGAPAAPTEEACGSTPAE